MEKYVIEQLQGTNRNAVEGTTDAPDFARNVQFKRSGGYIPLGGINEAWLGERSLSMLLQEDGNNLLYENNDPMASEWQPSPDFGLSELLAYDEAALALVSGPQLWANNQLISLTGDVFKNESDLALAPRSGVLAPWRRVDGGYSGGAWYRTTTDAITNGLGAGAVTFTDGTTGTVIIPDGTYEFLWTVEAPTDNGLVVYAVGQDNHTITGGNVTDVTIESDTIYPEGTVLRFYYRDSAQPLESASYERFAITVSNGVNEPEVVLEDPGTFLPTEDVLLNFAGGRVEAHNGRVWGPASEEAFLPFLPSAALTRSGGYMFVNGGGPDTLRQYGDVATADKGLAASGDFVELRIQELYAQRTHRTLPIIVELFSNTNDGNPDESLFGYLHWEPGQSTALFRVYFAANDATAHLLLEQPVVLSTMQLGTIINNDVLVRNLRIRFTIISVTDNGDGSITSICSYEIAAGEPTLSITGTNTLVGTDTNAFADWTAYSASDDTQFALGALPAAHLPITTNGKRYLKVSSIVSGNGSTVLASGRIQDYDPSTNLTSWTSASGETWTTTNSANMIVASIPRLPEIFGSPITKPNLTLIYSEVGSVNRGTVNNFVRLSPLSSTRITGLTSTPAGLVVFMENEVFLVRGDPDNMDFAVQRLTGTLGNDRNVIPGRLGSVVMPVYRGEVYAVSLGGGDVDFGGSLVNISQPVWLPDDPFVQVVGENVRNHLVGLTNAGRVFRFDVIVQQWTNCVFDEREDLRYLISACLCPTRGTRYNVGGYLEVLDSNLMTNPVVEWRGLSLGDKHLMKLWRRIELNYTASTVGLPLLRYNVRGISGVVSGLNTGGSKYVFTLPRGLVDSQADFEFEFSSVSRDFVLEPPIVIEFQPRYRQR